jgi:hypothetical protein
LGETRGHEVRRRCRAGSRLEVELLGRPAFDSPASARDYGLNESRNAQPGSRVESSSRGRLGRAMAKSREAELQSGGKITHTCRARQFVTRGMLPPHGWGGRAARGKSALWDMLSSGRFGRESAAEGAWTSQPKAAGRSRMGIKAPESDFVRDKMPQNLSRARLSKGKEAVSN